jgi:hypothetical protein
MQCNLIIKKKWFQIIIITKYIKKERTRDNYRLNYNWFTIEIFLKSCGVHVTICHPGLHTQHQLALPVYLSDFTLQLHTVV